MDQREFVEAVMAELHITKTSLGKALGKPNGYNAVHAWVQDEKPTKLGYDDTMRMLEMCGWLNMSADAATAGESIPRTPEELLAEVAMGMRALLAHFRLQTGAVPGEAAPKQKKSGRKR